MADSSHPPMYEHYILTYPIQFVAHVQINRARKMNAFFEPMWLELRQVFDFLSRSSSVRAVVLSGAGPKAFTAGLDVQATSIGSAPKGSSEEQPVDGARKAKGIRNHIFEFQKCIESVETCEKPVICVMHGYTYGLGIDLSTCADVRICSNDTKFSVKEVDIGIAADIGTLSRLPKVVGQTSWVKDVCLTARVFGAEEAFRVGLVSGVFDGKDKTLDEALKWAGLVASKSPVAVQGTKELINWSRDHSVQDGLRYTGVWNSVALQSDDVTSAMQAGLKKQLPQFSKL